MWYELSMQQCYSIVGAISIARQVLQERAKDPRENKAQINKFLFELMVIEDTLYDYGVSYKPDSK